MKDILQDRHAGLAPGGTPVGSQGPNPGFPASLDHVAGYSGFQPRCPTMVARPTAGPQQWASLNEINAARPEDRPGAGAYPPPYGIAAEAAAA